jgi:virginiamycin A acetyltransferase
MGLIGSALSKIELYRLRKDQYLSEELRALFRSRYEIEVGLYSYGCFDRWRLPGPMRVGRYCSFASTARSAIQNHPFNRISTHPVLYDPQFGVVSEELSPSGPLIIEDDVWIGQNAVILPGCKRIGRGAIVGAGAVVTRDVERYMIVGGNPAREIRRRFEPDLAAALEDSRWWELDLADLRTLTKSQPQLLLAPTVSALRAWVAGGRPLN